jgi:hypothetical protein
VNPAGTPIFRHLFDRRIKLPNAHRYVTPLDWFIAPQKRAWVEKALNFAVDGMMRA